jgi:hypothetical protein
MPPIGKQALDPEGKLPLYPLGTSFTISLPAVDPLAWQGKAGPPYITHGTVVELRWSPPHIPLLNALEGEVASGTYLYVVQLAEFKPPKNTWRGSEGKIRDAVASGLFKVTRTVAQVGAYVFADVERVMADLRFFMMDNDLLAFKRDLTTKRGVYDVVLRVPRGTSMVQGKNLDATQMFALGKIIARKFKEGYGHDIFVDWLKGDEL